MVNTIFSDLLSVFFPQFCVTCDAPLIRNEKLICTQCRMNIPRIRRDPLVLKKLEERLHGSTVFDHAFAYYKFYKLGLTQRLLHRIKYGNRPDIAVSTGLWFGAEIAACSPEALFDMIVPVPLHRKKRRARGYNQSACIAEGIALSTGIPMNAALQRIRDSDTQTDKSRIERWENVSGIFHIKKPEEIRNKHILLVDDVVTTGATLESCAATLMEGGAAGVSAAVLAIAM